MSLEDIFSHFLIVASILLAILYVLRFQKKGSSYKWFTGYLVLVAVIQIWMAIYAAFTWNNLFMSHFYFIGQFITFSFFYYHLLHKKWIVWVLGAGMLFLTIQYIKNPGLFFVFNSYGISITQTILVFYALLYFYKSLTNQGAFLLVNTGIFFYLITSILYFASFNLFLELDFDREWKIYVFRLHNTLYFVFEILIFIEWYKNFRLNKDETNYA
jgi:hypothetical protein